MLGLRTVGRAPEPLTWSEPRDLTLADMTATARKPGTQTLMRLRDSHHSAARLYAEGYSGVEISAITGYTQARLSVLRSDPAFVELIEFYRGRKEALVADAELRMKQLLLDTLQELQDRVDASPEQFSPEDLHRQAKLLADRTGLGPASKTQVDVRVGIAARLEAARERLAPIVTVEAAE